MESVQRYSGGGGTAQKMFKLDVTMCYERMINDAQIHLLSGFGEMECIKQLGPRMGGEVRGVQVQFVEKYDHKNLKNPILEDCLEMEERRELWRVYRMNCSAFATLGSTSGFSSRPSKPDKSEPRDLERFFAAIEARFRSSTTEYLTAVQMFKPLPSETPERMFARFNVLCKPLEDELPCVMTKDQMKTTFIFNLHLLLTSDESDILDRDVRHRERKRVKDKKNPLTRYEIHDMVLQQQREKVIELTKLRAVGLMQKSDKPEPPTRRLPKEREEGAAPDYQSQLPRHERETRICNNCGKKGHIMRNCRLPPKERATEDRPEKRQLPTTDEGPSKRPLSERLGAGRDPPVQQSEEKSTGKHVNPKNVHQTANAVCTFCGKPNHTAAQCWKANPHLAPFPKKATAMMVGGAQARNSDHIWEAEQMARQLRAKQFENDRKIELDQENSDEPETRNQQFMAAGVHNECDEMSEECYDDMLFQLSDKKIAQDFLALETPITETVQELRALQAKADQCKAERRRLEKRVVEDGSNNWFMTSGKQALIQPSTQMYNDLTYANVVGTRSRVPGVAAVMPTLEPPSKRSNGQKKKRVNFDWGPPQVNGAHLPPAAAEPLVMQRAEGSSTDDMRQTRRRTILQSEGGEGMGNHDKARIPMSFPLQDLGKSTPGTTDLRYPPDAPRSPPPVYEPSSSDEDELPPKTVLEQQMTLCHHMKAAYTTAKRIRDELRVKGRGYHTILYNNQIQPRQEARYHHVQTQNDKQMTMVTLITGQGQLTVEGHEPTIAVLDTGASAVILGKAFARKMFRCLPPYMAPGEDFITADGKTCKSLGNATEKLEFIIGKGTPVETVIYCDAMVVDTSSYDVILGMDFLAECKGLTDPLTEEFMWRVDCRSTTHVPCQEARLPVKMRGSKRDRRQYTIQVINCTSDLQYAILGNEHDDDNFDSDEGKIPITKNYTQVMTLDTNITLISNVFVDRAATRLEKSYRETIPVLLPQSKWLGGEFNGALPIDTSVMRLAEMDIQKGLHVLDLFSGITCSGLRTMLEGGYNIKCYTSVEIDDVSRAIAREVLSKLQIEYPGQLPDAAIRGYNKRLPQNIALVTKDNLENLIQQHGCVHFVCGGWECQSMSMAGLKKGMEDDIFPPFMDMVRIINFLQNQTTKPLYLFENTWPGPKGQYPKVDKASEVVEAFVGAPILVDAAGLGSTCHRVRLFWQNWCKPEILQNAFPNDVRPLIDLNDILHSDHTCTMPSRSSLYPFAQHNEVGKPRVCMPTIVSFPKSHAYRLQANGKPGEGQLWNKHKRCFEEPTIEEKEQFMGYPIGFTMGGQATPQERSKRLGQAMDGNTIRWFGAFLHAEQKRFIMSSKYLKGIQFETTYTATHHKDDTPPFDTTDPHYQACAIVEQLLDSETPTPNKDLGGSDTKLQKRKRDQESVYMVDAASILPKDNQKWKIGKGLTERDQLDVLKTLSENNDRFAYSLEDLGRYTGPPMEINLNTQKDIFRPAHKLGEKEMQFVGEQCQKLEKLGMIRRSDQSHYASATVVVRKKDEHGEYTDFRKCGDYRPINSETDLDRYQLPLIETIFNEMKGAKIFSKLDLRSGYHQMGLRECDRSKTAFWGAQRILWEWCVVPFGLKNAPPYFQRQMDKVLINMSFARCYIDDIIVWSDNLQDHIKHIAAVFERLRKAGLKVHPGKCEFAMDKINFLGHCVSAEGLSPQQEKVAAVRDLPAPTDVSSLRSALGLFSYYRKFVQGFSVMASPLHLLLRKGQKWQWELEQQTAFAELKNKLCTADVLKRPNSGLPYILATDWSQKGMGAVLSQIDKEGKEHPISYASRSCNPAEKNYGSCEGECLAVVWATQHFKEYLFGSPFTLITDHEPLKWLMQTNKTTGKLARWSLLLQECDMKVIHKSGILNTNADCLSRFPQQAPTYEAPLPDWNKGDYNLTPAKVFAFMVNKPENDESNQLDIWEDTKVLHFLKTHKYLPDLTPLQKDRVYRRAKNFQWLAHNLYKVQHGGMQMLLVPNIDDRIKIVHKIHRDMGHFGIKRVMDRLKKTYWWKGMEATTEDVVKACLPCARTKAGFRVSGTELHPLQLQGLMFRWGVDFAGPMLTTKRGNQYVLVCIEHFTKWVELIPLPSKSAEGVARAFLENVISRYGVPGVVLTDGGTEFQGEFQQLLTQQEITHRITSRDNPQADGLTERMVQTLKQSLRRCLLDKSWGLPWDDILPYVAMGYRISKQASTGYSPYFLLYGREPLFPSTIQHLDEKYLKLEDTAKSLDADIKKRAEVLQTVMPIAMGNLSIAQQRDKERFRHVRSGKYHKPRANFMVGEYVLVQHKVMHSLEPSVTPHILRIVEIRDTGVVILQGRDATQISKRIEQIAHCSVPIADHKTYPELFVSTDVTHCEICLSRGMESKMLLCDTCNKGYHTFCLEIPMHNVPKKKWHCPKHKVN